jgi:hypothetical protein
MSGRRAIDNHPKLSKKRRREIDAENGIDVSEHQHYLVQEQHQDHGMRDYLGSEVPSTVAVPAAVPTTIGAAVDGMLAVGNDHARSLIQQ